MKRTSRVLAIIALVAGAAGCEHPVTQDEHDNLVQRHDTTVGQLDDWADSVYDWQNRTYETICEIATLVDPDGDGDFGDIGASTQLYCDPGDGGGTPDPPPDWGA